MLQLHQRFMKFSTTNFPKFFRGIIPEKHRRKFPEISELTTLVGIELAICKVGYFWYAL